MCVKDEEHIKEEDKVLVLVNNQYMFEQLLWYHSKYPEGIWEAVIIKFGKYNDDLMDIMYQKCLECGFFSKIIPYSYKVSEKSLLKKMFAMFRYFFQYITRSREKSDRKLIESIVGKCDYKKIIIFSTYCSNIPVATLNAMPDSIFVCLEDGLADYAPATSIKHISELLSFILAKLNVMNATIYGHQFQLKNDNRLIKYCSLPDKMRYRGYKVLKQLFEDDCRKINFSEKELLLRKEKYDVIVFSTIFSDFGNYQQIYYVELQKWLKKNYEGKKILFKPHPREKYELFSNNDIDIHIGGEEMAGEKLLELLPDTEIIFTYTTTILLKACRDKRKFRILYFSNIASKRYRLVLEDDSNLLGISDDSWIIVGDKEDE
jgi:hypothetical protein